MYKPGKRVQIRQRVWELFARTADKGSPKQIQRSETNRKEAII